MNMKDYKGSLRISKHQKGLQKIIIDKERSLNVLPGG
jgi:hypothetical protein